MKHVVLAVNKIDLVGYDQTVFNAIEAEYRAFAKDLGFETLVAIPVSALRGDNILAPSPADALVQRPATGAVPRDHRGRDRPHAASRCASRCSG